MPAPSQSDRRGKLQAWQQIDRVGRCALIVRLLKSFNRWLNLGLLCFAVNGAGDPTIQGFSTRISIQRGEAISFKIKTDAAHFAIDIFRLGFYNGLGARHIDTITPSVPLPQVQPDCSRSADTQLVDCGNWEVTALWQSPEDITSGLFIARLTRPEPPTTWRNDNSQAGPGAWIPGGAPSAVHPLDVDEGVDPAQRPHSSHAYAVHGRGRLRTSLLRPRASLVYFVVRDDEGVADLLFQTSDTTW